MRHVLYCYRTDGSFRMITAHFNELWEARRFLELLWNADPWVWEENRMVSTSPQLLTQRGIKVRATTLEEVVGYDYTADTRNLELPEDQVRRARQIMTAMPDPEEVREAIVANRAERQARKERPKIDREGKVTIGAIAEELGMEAREARAILRSLKLEKPPGGWLFDPAEVDAVKEKLTAGR